AASRSRARIEPERFIAVARVTRGGRALATALRDGRGEARPGTRPEPRRAEPGAAREGTLGGVTPRPALHPVLAELVLALSVVLALGCGDDGPASTGASVGSGSGDDSGSSTMSG